MSSAVAELVAKEIAGLTGTEKRNAIKGFISELTKMDVTEVALTDTQTAKNRTVILFEVLHEGVADLSIYSLGAIDEECNEGAWSGYHEVMSSTVVSDEEMSELLTEQGSSPDFFNFDE